MIELLRSNDPVLLSFAASLLAEAGVAHFIADGYTSAVEGSIGALSRRLLIGEPDIAKARVLLIEAGLGPELLAHDRR